MTIAIIGAGVSGLACAEALRAKGWEVHLFDKGRGPGGRLSTRRAKTPLDELRFDHGAQYFSAKTPDFIDAVTAWAKAGAISPWTGKVVEISADGQINTDASVPGHFRWVGAPSMSQVVKHLASGLQVDWAKRAKRINGSNGRLHIEFEESTRAGPFSHVLVAVPAEQVSDLLIDAAPDLAAEARAIRSTPCWTVMAAFNAPVEVDWDGAKMVSSPLSWVCRNVSKPGRGPGETWVLQASAEWSTAHLEDAAPVIETALLGAFAALTSAPPPVFSSAHRWRYAFPQPRPNGPLAAFDEEIGIGACGDWHVAPDVEGAWRSGRALADHIISPA